MLTFAEPFVSNNSVDGNSSSTSSSVKRVALYSSVVNPKYSVISVAEDNYYGLPNGEIVNLGTELGNKTFENLLPK